MKIKLTSVQILEIIDKRIAELSKKHRLLTKWINGKHSCDDNFQYNWYRREKLSGKLNLLKSIRKEIV